MKRLFFCLLYFACIFLDAQERICDFFPAEKQETWFFSSAEERLSIQNNEIRPKSLEKNPLETKAFRNSQANCPIFLDDQWLWEFEISLENKKFSNSYFIEFYLYAPEFFPSSAAEKNKTIHLSLGVQSSQLRFYVFGKYLIFNTNLDFDQPQKFQIHKSTEHIFNLWLNEENIIKNESFSNFILTENPGKMGVSLKIGSQKPAFLIEKIKAHFKGESKEPIDPVDPIDPPPIDLTCTDQERSVIFNEFAAKDMIELSNTGKDTIDLQAWEIHRSSKKWVLPKIKILPEDYVVLVNKTYVEEHFFEFEDLLGKFTILNSDLGITSTSGTLGNTLILKNCKGKIIDQIFNVTGASGDSSMNLINPNLACFEKENWQKKPLSLAKKNKDTDLNFLSKKNLELIDIFWENEQHLLLEYNQNVSLTKAFSHLEYQINPLENNPRFLKFSLTKNWEKGKIQYIKNPEYFIIGCEKNQKEFEFIYGKGIEISEVNQLFINELMVHTQKREKYIEIYNASSQVLSLDKHYLGYRYGQQNKVKAHLGKRVILPEQYVVFTKNKIKLLQEFPKITPTSIIQLDDFPNYSNENLVFITNFGINPNIEDLAQENMLDFIDYQENMHHKSLLNTKDIALEKFHPLQKTQEKHNWSSALKIANYGTPTLPNSILHQQLDLQDLFSLENELFAPKKDGQKNNLIIHYSIEEPESYVRIQIYNKNGHLVRKLIENEPAFGQSFFVWNGENQQGKIVPMGMYILYIELYNPKNGKKITKKVCTVADYL